MLFNDPGSIVEHTSLDIFGAEKAALTTLLIYCWIQWGTTRVNKENTESSLGGCLSFRSLRYRYDVSTRA